MSWCNCDIWQLTVERALTAFQHLSATLPGCHQRGLSWPASKKWFPLQTLQTLQARGDAGDDRWPVPYAIMFVTGISMALWTLIIAVESWLIG
jgi:hypothetical protein